MNWRARHRRLLLVCLAALVLGCAWGWYTVHASGPWDASAADAVAAVESHPLRVPEVAIDALLKKPLFNPHRREPAVPEAMPASATLPPLVLVGVFREPGRVGVLLRSAGGESSGLVRPRQVFAGWTVVSIEPRRATVRSGDQVLVLELQVESDEQAQATRP